MNQKLILHYQNLVIKKTIEWKFNIFDDDKLEYDAIIGRDLMSSLGLDILFSKKSVAWEGIEIPMIDFRQLKKYKLSRKEFKAFMENTKEPIVTEQATKRVIKILDSNYQKANLQQVVNGATHLNKKQKKWLHNLLLKYESIFDGGLGEWNTDPVDFELKEGEQPHSQGHYPVPQHT